MIDKDIMKAMIGALPDKPKGVLKFTIGVEVSIYPNGEWHTKAFKMGKRDVVKKAKVPKKEIVAKAITKEEVY